MGCKPLTNNFFYPLEIIHSKKKATEQKKRINYYPFGLKHKGYNNVTSSNGNSTAQKKLFNGKELQDELGLDWYDYGARNYDASLGRWMNIDPLADHPKQLHASPFAYTNNNPVLYIDPDGKLWIDNEDGTYTAEEGDSASTLHSQHLADKGYTFEETNAMVEQQYGENRTEDGVEKSNVDPGDVLHEGKQMKSPSGLGVSYVTKDSGSDNNEVPVDVSQELPVGPDPNLAKKREVIGLMTELAHNANPAMKILGKLVGVGKFSRGSKTRSSTRTTNPSATVTVSGKQKTVHTGSRGGKYYVNDNGNKVYLNRDGTKKN